MEQHEAVEEPVEEVAVADVEATCARRLREVRAARRWSQAAMARGLSELGIPTTQETFARMETGARRIRLAEAFAFGAVLGVSPLGLALPADDDEPVCLTPYLTVRAGEMRRWAQGTGPLLDEETLEEGTATPEGAILPAVGGVGAWGRREGRTLDGRQLGPSELALEVAMYERQSLGSATLAAFARPGVRHLVAMATAFVDAAAEGDERRMRAALTYLADEVERQRAGLDPEGPDNLAARVPVEREDPS